MSTARDDLPTPASTEAALLIAFTRMEAKVDVALAQHGADLKAHADDLTDHETRLRNLEARPTCDAGLEDRLRAVEQKPTVSPRALGAVVTSVVGILLASLPFIDRLYS